MVQALSSSTSFTHRYQQHAQLLHPESRYYPCYKLIPVKRVALRKIKINETYNRDNQGYCFDPHQPLHLLHQQKSKPMQAQGYHNMQEQHCGQERPLLSIELKTKDSINERGSKRNVRFSKTTDVYELPERTSEDRYRSWYSKNDYVRFGNERKNTVHMIQQLVLSYQLNSDMDIDEYLDPNEHTIVGVEQYIYGKEQVFCRKLHMLRHIRSVLQKHKQQQYHKHHIAQQARDAEHYFYPESYDIDASQYHTMYYQHPSSCDESYLRYASHPCATMMHHPAICTNTIQHALHVL